MWRLKKTYTLRRWFSCGKSMDFPAGHNQTLIRKIQKHDLNDFYTQSRARNSSEKNKQAGESGESLDYRETWVELSRHR